MNKLKYILIFAVIVTALYSFFNQEVNMTMIMLTLVGSLFIILGIEELKKNKKGYGYILIAVALFDFFVATQHLILN